MSKKLYPDQDINDLIQSEDESFYKGGPGSGKKGHKTFRPTGPGRKPAAPEEQPKPKAPKASSNSEKVSQLNNLSEELKSSGQKHGAKVVDKKIKEINDGSDKVPYSKVVQDEFGYTPTKSELIDAINENNEFDRAELEALSPGELVEQAESSFNYGEDDGDEETYKSSDINDLVEDLMDKDSFYKKK